MRPMKTSLAVGVYLVSLCTLSQGTEDWNTGPVGAVLPMPGAPLSAQQVEERSQISSDGTVTTDIVTSQIYRDSAGRVRVDWYLEDGAGGRCGIAYLLDPVGYSFTILSPEQKIAFRDTVPRSSPAGFQVLLPPPGRPVLRKKDRR